MADLRVDLADTSTMAHTIIITTMAPITITLTEGIITTTLIMVPIIIISIMALIIFSLQTEDIIIITIIINIITDAEKYQDIGHMGSGYPAA